MRFPVRNQMPVDIRRVVLAAVQAALEDDRAKQRKGLSGGRAVAVGAALVVAARVAARPRGRLVREKLEEGFSSLTRDGRDQNERFDEDEEFEEPEAEEYDEQFEEPEAEEYDEEFEEPEAEYEEEPEDEGQYEEEPEDEEFEEPEAEYVEEPEDEGSRARPTPARRPPRHAKTDDSDDAAPPPPPRPSRRRAPVGRT
jgi:hypothetical protein